MGFMIHAGRYSTSKLISEIIRVFVEYAPEHDAVSIHFDALSDLGDGESITYRDIALELAGRNDPAAKLFAGQ